MCVQEKSPPLCALSLLSHSIAPGLISTHQHFGGYRGSNIASGVEEGILVWLEEDEGSICVFMSIVMETQEGQGPVHQCFSGIVAGREGSIRLVWSGL